MPMRTSETIENNYKKDRYRTWGALIYCLKSCKLQKKTAVCFVISNPFGRSVFISVDNYTKGFISLWLSYEYILILYRQMPAF